MLFFFSHNTYLNLKSEPNYDFKECGDTTFDRHVVLTIPVQEISLSLGNFLLKTGTNIDYTSEKNKSILSFPYKKTCGPGAENGSPDLIRSKVYELSKLSTALNIKFKFYLISQQSR